MENLSIFSAEFKYRTDEKDRLPPPSKFRRELKDESISTPGVEKYITAYPIAEWKKLAVCNFLVRMRSNGFMPEHRQLDN